MSDDTNPRWDEANASTPSVTTPVPLTAPRENEACCAHLRISYRTEEVRYDGPDVPSPEGSPYVGLRTGTMLTRGWWECDFNCGATFLPAPLPTAPEPTPKTRCPSCGAEFPDTFAFTGHLTKYPSCAKGPAPAAPEVVTPGLGALLTEYADAVWTTVAEGCGCDVATWPTHNVESATTDAEAWAHTAIVAAFAKLEGERVAEWNRAREAQATADVEHAVVLELRSTLSQVEGERDDVRRIALLRSQIITELEAQVAALRAEKDEATRVATHHTHVIQELQARVEGLTGALTKIAGLASDDDDGDPEWTLGEIVKLASSHDGGARHG